MTTASIIRTQLAMGFDAALRKGGIAPKSVRFERAHVVILLASQADLNTAKDLLLQAGSSSDDMLDHDLTETGEGHLLMVAV